MATNEELKNSIDKLSETVKDLDQAMQQVDAKSKEKVSDGESGKKDSDISAIAKVMEDSQTKFLAGFKAEMSKFSGEKIGDKISDKMGNITKGAMTSIQEVIARLIQDAVKNFEQIRAGTGKDVESIAIKHAQAGNPLPNETLENLRNRFEYSRQIGVREKRRVEEIVGTGSYLGEKTGLATTYRTARNFLSDAFYNFLEPEDRKFRANEDPNYLKMLKREKDDKDRQVNDNHIFNGTEG